MRPGAEKACERLNKELDVIVKEIAASHDVPDRYRVEGQPYLALVEQLKTQLYNHYHLCER